MNRTLKKRLLIALLAVVILAGGGTYLTYALGYWGEPQINVTQENLKEYLSRAMQTQEYITGKQNLALQVAGKVPAFAADSDRDAFYNPIWPYTSVEFLRSLTPEQIASIKGPEGRLYYKDLQPDQRELLQLKERCKRLGSPRSDPYDAAAYSASYGHLEAPRNSCPTLQWFFPNNPTNEGQPAFMYSSIPLNW